MMHRVRTTRRGRPRDPAINDAILTATRDLLLDVGYAGLSMEAVAARARISKPTLYLRYPSKGVLVFEAVFGRTKAFALPDTGDLLSDLREAYAWAVEEFAAAEARAALPGILAEASASQELGRLARSTVIEPEYARVHALLDRARSRGEVRSDVDLTLVIDAFLGTALARSTILANPLDHAAGARLVDLLVNGLAPRPAS